MYVQYIDAGINALIRNNVNIILHVYWILQLQCSILFTKVNAPFVSYINDMYVYIPAIQNRRIYLEPNVTNHQWGLVILTWERLGPIEIAITYPTVLWDQAYYFRMVWSYMNGKWRTGCSSTMYCEERYLRLYICKMPLWNPLMIPCITHTGNQVDWTGFI